MNHIHPYTVLSDGLLEYICGSMAVGQNSETLVSLWAIAMISNGPQCYGKKKKYKIVPVCRTGCDLMSLVETYFFHFTVANILPSRRPFPWRFFVVRPSPLLSSG